LHGVTLELVLSKVLDDVEYTKSLKETNRSKIAKWREKQKDVTGNVTGSETDKIREDKIREDKKRLLLLFEDAWNQYPNRVGKKVAHKHFLATVKNDADFDNLIKAINNYKKSEKVAKGFIQNGSTWFNDWESWVDRTTTKKKERWECT